MGVTVDIISPGGAFTPAATGDTQELTTTFTTSIGSPTLTCNGASPFVSGDTGKAFVIRGPGSAGVDTTWLVGTLTYVSATVCTMSVNATKALAAASAYMAWGTDDAPAFRAFNTYAQGVGGTGNVLTLGTNKKFIFASSDSNPRGGSITYALTNWTIQGSGSSLTKFIPTTVNRSFGWGAPYYLKTGVSVWPGFNYVARLDTVLAGSTTVNCKTPSDSGQFSVNNWALLMGFDLQGNGDPPNNFYYEYVYITNISSGVITFQSAVQSTYLDSWPNYIPGFPGATSDKGGPATLYALDPGWNQDVTLQGFEFNNQIGGQTPTKARKIVFRDVKISDGYGLFPTGSKEVEFYSCDLTSYGMEVDKITESVIFDATTTGTLDFQSSVSRCRIQNGSIIGSLQGGSRYLELVDSTVAGSFRLGVTGYGRNDTFTSSNSTVSGAFTYGGIDDQGDNTAALQTDYTMVNGLITMPRTGRSNTGPRWAVPGTRCYFTGREVGGSARIVSWGHMFEVTSFTQDATNMYVQTGWPLGGFPSWATHIRVIPARTANISGLVSAPAELTNLQSATTAGYTTPGTYSFKQLTGATAGTDLGSATIQVLPATGGRLVSLKVNVTTPYTGVAGTLNWGKATQYLLSNDGSTFLTWNPRFDLRTPGLRTITPAGVTGAVGADSIPAPTASAWFDHWLANMSTGGTSVIAEYNGNPAFGPVFTVELIVDQGLNPTAVVPLRLRLHA